MTVLSIVVYAAIFVVIVSVLFLFIYAIVHRRKGDALYKAFWVTTIVFPPIAFYFLIHPYPVARLLVSWSVLLAIWYLITITYFCREKGMPGPKLKRLFLILCALVVIIPFGVFYFERYCIGSEDICPSVIVKEQTYKEVEKHGEKGILMYYKIHCNHLRDCYCKIPVYILRKDENGNYNFEYATDPNYTVESGRAGFYLTLLISSNYCDEGGKMFIPYQSIPHAQGTNSYIARFMDGKYILQSKAAKDGYGYGYLHVESPEQNLMTFNAIYNNSNMQKSKKQSTPQSSSNKQSAARSQASRTTTSASATTVPPKTSSKASSKAMATPQPNPALVQPPTPQPNPAPVAKTSSVDTNIPTSKTTNENMFVIIIANEEYKNVAKVPYALNDGRIFAKYCQQTLGVPAKQVKLYENATYNDMRLAIAWLKNVCDKFEGDASVIFYYTGHGIPDESDKSAYLLPVDGDGRYASTGYKIDDLYEKLGAMPAKSITVLLDACFSGATRDGKMVSQAKGVAIKAKKGIPQGNTVVLSAAQGDETAGFKEDEGHGMFTYYLLKKLQATKGDVTLQDLSRYIIREVGRASVVDSKPQTPCVTPSATLGSEWQNWKLK